MDESWIRQAALDRGAELRREAEGERLARKAVDRSEARPGDREGPTPLLTLRLIGRLRLRVELWPR